MRNRLKAICVGLLASAALSTTTFAQCKIGEPGCPDHKVVATAPVGTFFENIALGADGAFYITDYTGKRIVRFTDNDGLKTYAEVDAHPLGIIVDTDNTVYFTAQEKTLFGGGGTFHNANRIYRIRSGSKPELFLQSADAHFLNGMLRIAPGRFLIADSRGGVIWELAAAKGRLSKFLVSPLLDTSDDKIPTPGANGIKINNGYLYISNTIRGTFVRVKFGEDMKPGEPEVWLENARADDFDFSPSGVLYFTTHRDKIMRIIDGKPQEFAGGGTSIVGNTALAWNAKGEGPYVIGDGGLVGNKSYKGPEPVEATIVRFGSR
jgi:sugar lactone lactonase YvrE